MKSPALPLLAVFAAVLSVARADNVDLDYGLVAHLTLDGNAQDVSGHGNDGTIVGLSSATDRFGNAGGALQFDKNGYVQINNSTLLNGATSAAITGWFKNDLAANEYGFVIGSGDSRAGLDPFALESLGDGRVAQSIFTQTTRGPAAADRYIGFDSNGQPASLGEWNSFVMQFTSIGNLSIFQFYLNGELERQTTYDYSLKITYDQAMPVEIGALTGFTEGQFRGAIDDVRFYDRALNTDEVLALNGNRVPEGGVSMVYLGGGVLGLLLFGPRRRGCVRAA